jgi:hypothetical protein
VAESADRRERIHAPNYIRNRGGNLHAQRADVIVGKIKVELRKAS